MMKMESELISRKLSFPCVMTVISFVMFIIAYLVITIYTVRPYYLTGLLFAIPFLIFGIIALITGKQNKKAKWVDILTGVLIPVFLFAACLLFYSISMHAASIKITDVRYYSRALARSSYPRWARDFHPVIRALTGRTKKGRTFRCLYNEMYTPYVLLSATSTNGNTALADFCRSCLYYRRILIIKELIENFAS
jgi:hypothetical protein